CDVTPPTSRLGTQSRWAVAGLIRAALSQVSLVRGLGSSCSQPLLANRPSQIVGSGRRRRSIEERRSGGGDGRSPSSILKPPYATSRGGSAVFAIRPS